MVLLRRPTNYSRAKYMDQIQSHKDFEKTPSIQRMGLALNSRSFAFKSRPSLTGGLFFIYRRFMVPILHAFGICGCRFVPSCSHYAEHLFEQNWSLKNFFMVSGRLLRCNAWTTPVLTFDPPTNDYLLRKKI